MRTGAPTSALVEHITMERLELHAGNDFDRETANTPDGGQRRGAASRRNDRGTGGQAGATKRLREAGLMEGTRPTPVKPATTARQPSVEGLTAVTLVGRDRLTGLVYLVYWGLTPQQQPGSYQGGEMMMMKISYLVEETGVLGGNHRPTASN